MAQEDVQEPGPGCQIPEGRWPEALPEEGVLWQDVVPGAGMDPEGCNDQKPEPEEKGDREPDPQP